MKAKWVSPLGVAAALILAATGSASDWGVLAGVLIFTIVASLVIWEILKQ